MTGPVGGGPMATGRDDWLHDVPGREAAAPPAQRIPTSLRRESCDANVETISCQVRGVPERVRPGRPDAVDDAVPRIGRTIRETPGVRHATDRGCGR